MAAQTVGPVSAQPASRRSCPCASRRTARLLATALAFIAMLLVVGALPGQSAATTFSVTKTADTDDGVCDADCSLREAVKAAFDAQASACPYFTTCQSPAETVAVPAGTYLEPLGVIVVNAVGFNYGLHGAVSVVGAGSGKTIV